MSNVFDLVVVDSDSDEILTYAEKQGAKGHKRNPELLKNTADGNMLLLEMTKFYDAEFYFQLFNTAPFLKIITIKDCVSRLVESTHNDSILTTLEHKGFFWYKDHPINYIPNAPKRSQDLISVVEETTGFYGITKESLLRYSSRIGITPLMIPINKYEAVDLNTEEDLTIAVAIAENIKHIKEEINHLFQCED